MNLELMALRWLRFERKCPIALCERSPRVAFCGQPDALGVTTARYLIEIEIKRSLSDFRADFRKPHRINAIQAKSPKEFWYCVPPGLAPKVMPELPSNAGLLSPMALLAQRNSHSGLIEIKPCAINRLSQRLTIKECCRLVPMMANHIVSAETRYESIIASFHHGYEPWMPSGVVDFQI